MYELNSQNLDVVSAEVAYRHHADHIGARDTDLRDLRRGRRWSRRNRRSAARSD